MAIYHLSTKPISRSSGRTATASIAYRAGIAITDERTGKQHDYTKRGGVVATQLHTPNNLPIERNQLWNLAEQTETRKNSRTAREIVVNLPHELPPSERSQLVNDFAKDLADKYGVGVDVAIHKPDKHGDNRNHHAHIMLTTRKLERLESGKIALTSKSQLEMSNTQLKERGLPTAKEELKAIRKQWADMTNERLERAEINARIDHRSHKDRGLIFKPTKKLGWEASALERKGIRTETGDHNRQVKAFNKSVRELMSLNRQLKQVKIKDRAKPAEKTPPKQLIQEKSEVTAVTEPKQRQATDEQATRERIDKGRDLLKQFHKGINNKAKEIHEHELKEMVKNVQPLYREIKELQENKPINPFKTKAWEQELNSKVEVYNKIKSEYETKKSDGITKEHKDLAKALFYKAYPEQHDTLVEIQKDVNEYDQQQAEIERQQRLAEMEQRRTEREAQRAERGNDKGMER